MKNVPWIKDTDLLTELESIRTAIMHIPMTESGKRITENVDYVSQGNLLLDYLQDWLLDDEQKQILDQSELTAFFLNAAAYLCDIGLRDGGGNRDAQNVPKRLGQRSHDFILNQWKYLGVADMARAKIIAKIVGCMGPPADRESTPQNISFADSPIDVALLAGFLRLSKALALKTAATSKEIHTLLPDHHHTLIERPDQHFDVTRVGPHPYFPATIQIKICCRHPEIHRALKHHERAIQQQLTDFNQVFGPAFYISDLIFEIDQRATSPWTSSLMSIHRPLCNCSWVTGSTRISVCFCES